MRFLVYTIVGPQQHVLRKIGEDFENSLIAVDNRPRFLSRLSRAVRVGAIKGLQTTVVMGKFLVGVITTWRFQNKNWIIDKLVLNIVRNRTIMKKVHSNMAV